MTSDTSQTAIYGNSLKVWMGLAGLSGLVIVIFLPIAQWLTFIWLHDEAYSHGIMIPILNVFLIWQNKREIARYDFSGSWTGIIFLIAGIAVYAFGELSSLQVLLEYAMLIMLLGFAWAIVGEAIFRIIWAPLFFFFFAIPLPNFLYQQLSAKLQLLSSELGVWIIRLFDISVYLEGNVIDLGAMKLQVVEACSGLTYLFPLTSVAFICAYFYQAPFWKRAIIFLSSIPITVLMNSFRVGMIGILVEYWGKPMAEGFLHDFEGWIVFMGCTAILVGEIWLLTKLSSDSRPFQEVFGLVLPEPWPPGTTFQDRTLPKQFWVAGVLILATLGFSVSIQQRQEIVPQRAEFLDFPMKLGNWTGRRQAMEQEYIDTLKFQDYLLADYVRDSDGAPVNLYSAYYASQRQGASIHSPRTCLPGGGWKMKSLERVQVEVGDGTRITVNRSLIQKGDERELVYYWFRQRGRDITDEYQAKWYLFWDAITRNRTDGALIRVIAPLPGNEDESAGDKRIADFLNVLHRQLSRFVPN